MKVHNLKGLACVPLELLISTEGEEAGRLVPVVHGEPFVRLAAIDAKEEQSAGAQQLAYGRENVRQLGVGDRILPAAYCTDDGVSWSIGARVWSRWSRSARGRQRTR